MQIELPLFFLSTCRVGKKDTFLKCLLSTTVAYYFFKSNFGKDIIHWCELLSNVNSSSCTSIMYYLHQILFQLKRFLVQIRQCVGLFGFEVSQSAFKRWFCHAKC